MSELEPFTVGLCVAHSPNCAAHLCPDQSICPWCQARRTHHDFQCPLQAPSSLKTHNLYEPGKQWSGECKDRRQSKFRWTRRIKYLSKASYSIIKTSQPQQTENPVKYNGGGRLCACKCLHVYTHLQLQQICPLRVPWLLTPRWYLSLLFLLCRHYFGTDSGAVT